MQLKIGDKRIGPGHPAFIIAEAGVNHNGSAQLALQLIQAAADAGADCVKFQSFKAETVVNIDAPKANYQLETTDPSESQFDMLKSLELPRSVYPELIKKAQSLGIEFMSTPYDTEDVDFLESLGVNAFKAASISMVEPSFLKYLSKKNKPIICSTGLCTEAEIHASLQYIPDYANHMILLQCTTDYPAKTEDSNILAMGHLRRTLHCIVGYSDHTENDIAVITAIANGASVIEKHLTLDRSSAGPDQRNSYEPNEFKRLVKSIRQAEVALGSSRKKPSERELKNLTGMRRSLVAKKDLFAGDLLDFDNFFLKRPVAGITPIQFAEFEGSAILRTIKAGEVLQRKHIM